MIELTVNGAKRSVDAADDMPLLWVLRDILGMTGTKFGCGIGACGACTVHVDGTATRSCVTPVSAVSGTITTIEGLPGEAKTGAEPALHPLQKAWIDLKVPQCGYCQSGFLMAAADLLKSNPKPTDADIDAAITNICRCGTYNRIRKAIHQAAAQTAGAKAA